MTRRTMLSMSTAALPAARLSHAASQDAAAVNRDLERSPARLVPTAHPAAQWFPGAGLGLFLHWGIASVHGEIDISWGMMHGMGGGTKITPEEYFRLAARFRPDHWEPDRVLAAAAGAGFRYAVLTAKHHEGFALWPSRFGDFNTSLHAGGADLVGPFVEACRKHGLKAGLYYSPGDWYFARRYMSFHYRSEHCWQNTGLTCRPGVPDFDQRFEPVQLPARTPEFERAFREYKRGQIHELLSRYGTIDLLWFDMADLIMTPDEIRRLQPGIVINNRMGGGTGDFLTPEGAFPKQRPAGWWELCSIWNTPNWGYVRSNEERYLPAHAFLSTLAKTRSWNGNLLMNAAPRPDGSMPAPFWKGIEEIGAWMRHSGEALFGTAGGPWPEDCPCPVTTKGNLRYLLVPREWQETTVTLRTTLCPLSATLLRTSEPLRFSRDGEVVSVEMPAAARSGLVDVIAIKLAS